MPSPLGNWGSGLAFAGYLLASVSPTALLADPASPAAKPALSSEPLALLQLADSSEGGEGESGEGESGEGESGEGESGEGESGEGEGGEGEGGAGGPFAGAEPETMLLGQLLMTRGHLQVGYSLAAQGMMAAGKPHLHHPVDENYPLIEAALAERKLEPFEAELETLGDAEHGELADIQADFDAVIAKIDADAEAVLAADADRTELALDTALRVLKQAADEYAESIENGAIVNPIEYQDSMAFAAEARRIVEGEADALIARDGAKYAALLAEFDALQQAWPSAVPPAAPVLSTEAVYGGVSRIELALLPLKA